MKCFICKQEITEGQYFYDATLKKVEDDTLLEVKDYEGMYLHTGCILCINQK